MKLKNTLALAMAAVLAAGLTACGSSTDTTSPAADSTAAESTEAAADTTAAPDGDGDPTTLTVAMECAYAPYNWIQSDDANGAVEIRGSSDYAYGYDVMMAKKIGEALGQKVQIVKLDWDSLIPAFMSGDVDCVIAGQSITADRAAQVDFSDPYYYASIITLTKKDSAYANATSVADLAGATATSQLGTIWYDTCLPQIENANILPAQETAPAMLVALNSGACDIVVTDRPTAQAALVAYPDFTLLDFGGGDKDFAVSDEDINIGISMKKGNTALKDAINEVLATMTTDDYNKMMDEAISVQPLSESFTRLPLPFCAAGALVLVKLRNHKGESHARLFRKLCHSAAKVRLLVPARRGHDPAAGAGRHVFRLPDRLCGGRFADHPR